ncbi:membrane protein [Deinococcus cellulosilyticus NBRC 106333 = KACC 11606]|uniref:Membrane protein n=1 Tax=Deinococcus cellulosilyticus (strain DSM 18568 / NBRC 106333 / KACC 11606 / 5516J-15) TaxID=1223518 RepID=A0A511N5P3_DEIC1|nr:membrane protein [Deinococcus cellulosilyticus NBRC 106333 = KACC 11606]
MLEHLQDLILKFGYIGIGATLLLETGFLIFFFLPGDTLLLAVGAIAYTGKLALGPAILSAFIGAVLGNAVGYWVGAKYGRAVFSNQNSRLFNPENIAKAEHFYNKYGAMAIMLSRFVPGVRAIVPTIAGMVRMNYGMFMLLNIASAALWTVSLPLLAYYVLPLTGLTEKEVEKYILVMVFLAFLIPLIPVGIRMLKPRKSIQEKV